MIIKFFEKNINDSYIYNRLTENNFYPRFTFKHKLYYKFIRPILPIYLRQKLQVRVKNKITWKRDFIDDELVVWLQSEKVLSEKINNLKYNKKNECAIVLTHDVEEQSGFDFIPKVIELEEKYGFKSSWNIVPYKYKIDEGIIKLIRDAGHEIGIHGYNHDGKLYYSEKIFNYRVKYINDAIKKYGAVGFRSPQVHRNLIWLQKLDIEYDASCFDYDPFQPFPGGTGSIWPFIAGKFVELPYTLPQDHTLFYVLKQKDITIWRKKADWVAKNHGVILTLTHPDYLKEKNHLEMYEELLMYLKNFHKAWYCLPKELAKWWKESFN
jgi:peptidoglycan/xylan/chitin deacetylase (PgdA/CDA1 family)